MNEPPLKYATFLAVSILLGASCHLFHQQQPFEVAEATCQKYIAGVPEGGSSLHYTFKLLPIEGAKFNVDTIWVDSIPHKARQLRTNKNLGDTIVIKAIHPIDDNQDQGKDHQKTLPPKEINGRALLQYKVGQDRRYYPVDTLKELKPVPFP